MKPTSLILFSLILVISACKNEITQKNISLSGSIENPNSDTLKITDYSQKVIKVFLLNNGIFKDTLNIQEGYYKLDDGKENTNIYLKPGFDLNLTLNTETFDESINYSGLGATENNYLAQKALLEESLFEFTHSTSFVNYKEEPFLKTVDSIYRLRMDLFESSGEFNESFTFLESNNIEMDRIYALASFENSKRYFSEEKEFQVSNNFPNPYDKINLSDDRLLKTYLYLTLVEKYISDKTRKELKENQDFFVEYIKIANEKIDNPKIKEKLLYNLGKYNLAFVEDLDLIYNEIKPFITNQNYLSEITKSYEKLKKIEKGAISPNFKFNDLANKEVTLSDFKGKLIYIDVWATWCAPCLQELPALKKVEEKYKDENIVFVSICKDDSKERWLKMINDKELKGVQLFAEEDNSSFFEDYAIQGIPWYILIDEEGKIIDSNAKRPSDPKLIEEIDSYL